MTKPDLEKTAARLEEIGEEEAAHHMRALAAEIALLRPALPAPYNKLNSRALYVIRRIAAGASRADIAAELECAEVAVTGMVRRACRTFSLPYCDHATLVDAALAKGVIALPPLPPIELPEALHDTLRLIAEGLTNHQIGRRLDRSYEAVKSRVKLLLARLEATDRAHAVAIGWQRALLGPHARRSALSLVRAA